MVLSVFTFPLLDIAIAWFVKFLSVQCLVQSSYQSICVHFSVDVLVVIITHYVER